VIHALLAATLVVLPTAITDHTETFTIADHAAGEAFEWTVPEGVTTIAIEAAGGNGGAFGDRPANPGTLLTTVAQVSEGQVLTITLGGDGAGDGTPGAGFGTGGIGQSAAGGGGSTGILLDGAPLLVAGAGGGAGGTAKAGFPGADGAGGTGGGVWAYPGGSGYIGGGGDAGTQWGGGAGGGAGYGGGGAGGPKGDGGAGGSTPGALSYAPRTDTTPGGWVTIVYTQDLPDPIPTATPVAPVEADNGALVPVAIGAGVVILLGIGLALVRGRRRA